jgi:hypothetical protein
MRRIATLAVCWTSSAVLVWALDGLHRHDARAQIIAAVTLAVVALHNFLYPLGDTAPEPRRCPCCP